MLQVTPQRGRQITPQHQRGQREHDAGRHVQGIRPGHGGDEQGEGGKVQAELQAQVLLVDHLLHVGDGAGLGLQLRLQVEPGEEGHDLVEHAGHHAYREPDQEQHAQQHGVGVALRPRRPQLRHQPGQHAGDEAGHA